MRTKMNSELLSKYVTSGAELENEMWLLATQSEAKQETVWERLEVIDRYLQIDSPTGIDADAAAAEIGIARRRFYRLIANLRSLGPVRALSPGFRNVKRKAPTKDGLEKHVEIAIQKALREEPDAKMAEIYRFVAAECERLEASKPSPTAVRRRVHAIRRSATPLKQGETIGETVVVDQVALDLVIDWFDGARLSVITLIIDFETRIILGFGLSIGEGAGNGLESALHDMSKRLPKLSTFGTPHVGKLSRVRWTVPPSIEYAADALSSKSNPREERPDIEVFGSGPRRHGDQIMRLIGDRIGPYEFRRLTDLVHLPRVKDQPATDFNDAVRIVGYAVEKWNQEALSNYAKGRASSGSEKKLIELSEAINTTFKPVFGAVRDHQEGAAFLEKSLRGDYF